MALLKKSSSASATDSKKIFTLVPQLSDKRSGTVTLRDVVNILPVSKLFPVTTFSTPAGSNPPINSIRHMILVGVCAAGTTTTQHPAASVGAIFQAAINN